MKTTKIMKKKENKLRVLHALRGANISQKFSSQATVMSEILDGTRGVISK